MTTSILKKTSVGESFTFSALMDPVSQYGTHIRIDTFHGSCIRLSGFATIAFSGDQLSPDECNRSVCASYFPNIRCTSDVAHQSAAGPVEAKPAAVTGWSTVASKGFASSSLWAPLPSAAAAGKKAVVATTAATVAAPSSPAVIPTTIIAPVGPSVSASTVSPWQQAGAASSVAVDSSSNGSPATSSQKGSKKAARSLFSTTSQRNYR